MTETRRYTVEIELRDSANTTEVEEHFREILAELYASEGVDVITVRDRTTNKDESIEALLPMVESVESEWIMKSIELLREMEKLDDD